MLTNYLRTCRYQGGRQDAADQYQAAPAAQQAPYERQGYQEGGYQGAAPASGPSYMDYTPPAYGASGYPTQPYTTQSYAVRPRLQR